MARQSMSENDKVMQELAERDKAVQKVLLSTYGSLTADRILRNLGIALTAEQLIAHIKHPHTFYHQVMRVPALAAFNEIIYEQGRDLQAYTQQKMIHYLYSDEAAKSDSEPGAELRAQIEQDRLVLVQLNQELQTYFEGAEEFNFLSQKKLQQRVAAWHSSCEEVSHKLTATLQKNGAHMVEQFQPRLQQLIANDAVTVELTPKQLKKYGVKQAPIGLEKAVIYLLTQEQ